MMGRLEAQENLFYRFRIEDHVPKDHLLRKIDWLLDFDAIRADLADLYSHTGRPSVDPELMLRMLLVGYLYGIRSERRLVEEVHLNLAYRWFCKLGLEGGVPDRSTFSKNRHGRFADGDIMRRLFESVVEKCVGFGFVGGTDAAVDGSTIEADANRDRKDAPHEIEKLWSHKEQVQRPVADYLAKLADADQPAPPGPKKKPPKYLSETDPEAAWCLKDGPGRFSYETNYLIDTDHGIIMDVEATPARLSQEIIATKTMLDRSAKRHDFQPDRIAADGSYGTGPFLAWLLKRNVTPHIPVLDRKHQTNGKYDISHFQYDADRDSFTCLEGHEMSLRRIKKNDRIKSYFAGKETCGACPIRKACTDAPFRTVTRHMDEDARQTVRDLKHTWQYDESRRRRKKVEMLFAQAINCRCRAEPFIPGYTQNVVGATAEIRDGFILRHPNDGRLQEFRNAAAEMRALRPALEALAANANKTGAQEAEQRLLARAFREAAFRYVLAAPLPNALASSDLLFGPLGEQEKLLAETEAFRQGMRDLARGLGESSFFEGTTPGNALEELRTAVPESAARYLDAIALLAGVEHLPQSVLSGNERRAVLRNLGRGLVAAARGVEQERWDGRPLLRSQGELAQWDALHDELQRIAGLGVSEADGRAVRAGMREETGRRFYPEALALVSGGLLGAISRAAPQPIRITSEMLDDGGRFLGQRNAGPQAPRFGRWLENSDNVVEIMPGGQVRYTTRINDTGSFLNGQRVSVSYTDGVPDFSQLGLARVDIPNPVGRGVGINRNADLRAASRALWQEIESGRVPRSRFTQDQLDDLAAGIANTGGLTWHHNGIRLNSDGTGPMLLLDSAAHRVFQHVGWASTINRLTP